MLVSAVVAGRTPANDSTRRGGASLPSSISAAGSLPLPRSVRVTPSGALPTVTPVRRLATAARSGGRGRFDRSGHRRARAGSAAVCSPDGAGEHDRHFTAVRGRLHAVGDLDVEVEDHPRDERIADC